MFGNVKDFMYGSVIDKCRILCLWQNASDLVKMYVYFVLYRVNVRSDLWFMCVQN